MFKITTNKILVAGLIVVAIVGYFIFRNKSAAPLTTVETGIPNTIGQELVIELSRLRSLQNLGGEIFADPAFASLQDFTQNVSPRPLGRNNPLAPIGNAF